MNSIRELHNRAMEFAEQALIEKYNGDEKKSLALFNKAFEFERDAADIAVKENIEPARSILLRSAATLALDIDNIVVAEKLVALGLSGNPPIIIAEELRNLYENINFSRHLETQNISLVDNEVQLSLSGNAVGYGVIQAREILNRVEIFNKLIIRTAERFKGTIFRDKGLPKKDIRNLYKTFIGVPQAGSFSVILRIGATREQPGLPIIDETNVIINDVIDKLSLLNENQNDVVRNSFSDISYYRNFIGLSKSLAPDGKNIRQVGFTIKNNGNEKKVGLTKSKSEITKLIKETQERKIVSIGGLHDHVEISGYLKKADDLRKDNKGVIFLIDENEITHKILVPSGIMSDIVGPLWDAYVTVSGIKRIQRGGYPIIDFEDITESESPY